MNEPKLAVVIPTFNRARTLRRAIESVLANPRRDLELVVVDDFSTDGTPALLAGITDSRLTVVRMSSQGHANRARNRGVQSTTAPVIAFLDSDDEFGAGRVDRMIGFFENDRRVDAVVDGFQVIRGRSRRMFLPAPRLMTAEALVRVLVFHALPLTTSAIAVRRSALEDVGGFDPGLPRHQDRDLLLRLAVHHSVAIATGADVIKYQSPDSFSRDATTYMSGLDALVARHPAFLDPAAHDVLAYLIARVMIREFATGRIGPALQAARALRSAKHLPMGPLSALSHYWRGRRMRRKAEAELAKASPHDPEGVKATAPGPHHRQ